MKLFKKWNLIAIALLLMTSFTSIKESDLVGKWKGVDKGEIGYLTITSDGYAEFELEGNYLGGKSFDIQGGTANMKYYVDEDMQPAAIDFVVRSNATSKELGRFKGIYEMNSVDELHLAIKFEGTGRPTDFSKDDIILKRIN